MAKKKADNKKGDGFIVGVEKMLDILEIPKDAILNTPVIAMTGNSEISVENHKGIIEYSKECIKLGGGRFLLKITGRNLEIKNMTGYEIIITGFIVSVEFIS